MNTDNKCLLLWSAIFFLAMSDLAIAHDISGSLGNSPSSIDQYQIHCFDDNTGPNAKLEISVQDNAPKVAAKVSLQVAVNNTAFNTTDAVDGDASFSPELSVKGDADEYYYVTVNKTGVGEESYLVEYHCMTSDSQHTGTDSFQLTDQ